jgi:peptide/nickel transport system substrate-binding protein
LWHHGEPPASYLASRNPGLPASTNRPKRAAGSAGDGGTGAAAGFQLTHLAAGQATVTCQIVPAGFPDHQNYCPYTTGIKDGIWHGPDMTKARQLAKESRTTNVPVTVWSMWDKPLGTYLVQLLRQLGYRANLRTVSSGRFFRLVGNFHSKIHMGGEIWGSDVPSASDFFVPVLTCRSFYQDPANTYNVAEFCDPHVDKLASEAQTAQPTDPAAARKLWAQVDRIVTDQSPWVPVLNGKSTTLVSSRVGNYQYSPEYGPLLDQMWVR